MVLYCCTASDSGTVKTLDGAVMHSVSSAGESTGVSWMWTGYYKRGQWREVSPALLRIGKGLLR